MIGKIVPEDNESFQYILAKPVNYYYLLNILTHVIKGLKLCSESPSPMYSASDYVVKIPPDVNKRGFRVLLADDNDFCRNAVIRLLQGHTQNIVACEDGAKALATYKSESSSFDLGVFDYQMPNMDGISLIEEIRKYEAQTRKDAMKIICISSL